MTRNNVFYIFKRIISVILTMSVLLMMTPGWSVTVDSAEVTHYHSGWEKWTDPAKLPTTAGSYYLDTNVTLSQSWSPSVSITLCLNGHTIEYNNSFPTIGVNSSGILDIYDCQGSGTVTNSSGRTLLISNGGTANIYGGKFINNTNRSTIINDDGGTLNMSGGEITYTNGGNGIENSGDANVKNVKIKYAGSNNDDDSGIYCRGGGTITVEDCEIESGTGICVYVSYGTAKIIGGTFNGRYGIYNDNGTIELSGSPTISGSTADIFLISNQKTTVTGSLNNTIPYSVMTQTNPTEDSPVVFTTGATTYNDTTKFTAADSNYAVRKNSDGQLELAASEHTHDDIIFEPWTDTERLPDSGSYYLENDVTLSSPKYISGSLTLCLNGHTIKFNGLPIRVQDGGTLGIYDCQGNGAVTTPNSHCIRIDSGGTANIYGGTFNGSNDANSPTIYVDGTVTIENASVFGQQPVQIVSYGIGTINGGTFESTDKPTIDVQTNASLEITDGTFIRNTGGNIIQNQGKLEMSGGTVTGKSSSSNGAVGIVNSGTKATATIKDVTITTEGTATDDNTKADKGLRNDNGGTMIVENCNISSTNRAVWNTGSATIKISGGTFNGIYGMYNNSGTFELSGSPAILGSTGDIYLSSGQKITVAGALGNAAPYSVLTETAPTVGSPVVITNSGDTSYNNADKFTPANNSYILRKNSSDQLELALLATYTVTYEKGTPSNVTGSHNADTVTEGESVTLPGAVFTRTGYKQTGWATSDGGAKAYELNETFSPDDNITLYPCWTANTYTVTFEYNGATGNNSTEKKEVTFGSPYGTLPSPTKTGYTFDSWFTAASGGSEVTSNTTVTITESQTLYAHWTAKQFTLTFDYQGATGGYETSSITVTYDSTYGELPTPKKTGFSFGGWFTAANGQGNKVTADTKVEITAAQTLYASWIECQHEDMEWTADQDGEHHSGTCDNCGKDVSEEHNWQSKVTTPPTAENEGIMHKTCSDCGTETDETIPPHEHVFEGEWKHDEESHWQECPYDNIKGNQADHSWNNGTVTKEATSTEKGVKTYECTVCKATKTEDIPATSGLSGGGNSGGSSGGTSRPSTGTTPPSTGDSSDPSDNTSDQPTGDNTDPSGGNGSGNITVNSESGENAPDVSISEETLAKLKEEIIAEHLTPEEKAAIANGDTLDIILQVKDAGDTVPAEDKQVTEAVLTNTAYNIGMYLNIDLIKLINGQIVGKITEINSPIRVTIEIPEELRSANRAFAIVRVHDGAAEILEDVDDDPDTITIVTDKFSTYSIAYQDTDANPNTGTTTPIAITGLACAVIVAAVAVKRKKIIE